MKYRVENIDKYIIVYKEDKIIYEDYVYNNDFFYCLFNINDKYYFISDHKNIGNYTLIKLNDNQMYIDIFDCKNNLPHKWIDISLCNEYIRVECQKVNKKYFINYDIKQIDDGIIKLIIHE